MGHKRGLPIHQQILDYLVTAAVYLHGAVTFGVATIRRRIGGAR